MSLGHALRRIAEEYPEARLDPPAGHPLAAMIRTGAPDALRRALRGIDGPFLIKGSPLPVRSIQLGSAGALPEGYEGAHILGLSDGLDELGDERRLIADLATGVAAYRALKARGGLALPDAGPSRPPPAA